MTTVLALAAVLVSPSAASAAAGNWSVQPIPAAPRPDGRPGAVSCPTATACMSVGTYVDQYGVPRTLAQRWDGRVWRATKPANRADAADSRLTGVSCRSATVCLAVGSYTDTTGTIKTLAERWDGTSWHITAIPDPAGAVDSGFSAVSCRSVTLCFAVGYYTVARGNTKTLAQRWDGTRWRITAMPDPDPSTDIVTYAKLTGVSRPTTSRCIAVGGATFNGTSSSGPLAEEWNGTTWTLISPVNQDKTIALSAVSCVSASNCTAVGYHRSGEKSFGTLVETWDGATWVVQTTPNPQGSATRQSFLNGVSCASPTACTAVGTTVRADYLQTSPLAEVWDGSTWTITPAAGGKAGSNVPLNGVSCPAADACTAVGYVSGPYNGTTNQIGRPEAEATTLAEVWHRLDEGGHTQRRRPPAHQH